MFFSWVISTPLLFRKLFVLLQTGAVVKINTAFFEKILDVDIEWKNIDDDIFEGYCSKTSSNLKASAVDLIFGSNSRLRAISEVYASKDSKNKFIKDFINAWTKVMNADRFDVA